MPLETTGDYKFDLIVLIHVIYMQVTSNLQLKMHKIEDTKKKIFEKATKLRLSKISIMFIKIF